MSEALFLDLKDKTVVVTGAGKGIGKATAIEFLKQGAKLILISKSDINWLDDFDKDKYIFLKKDINDIGYFEAWLKEYSKKDNIDVFVSNAGIIHQKKLLDESVESWDEIMNTNAKSTFFLAQLFAKHMKENKNGSIIFASSFATKLPSFSYGLYAASKSVVLSLVKSLAAELAPYNVRVNSYCPGVIQTQMTKPAIDKNKNQMLKDISLNRFGDAKEVSHVILFLASSSSSYITGADLDVSGGKFIIQNAHLAY